MTCLSRRTRPRLTALLNLSSLNFHFNFFSFTFSNRSPTPVARLHTNTRNIFHKLQPKGDTFNGCQIYQYIFSFFLSLTIHISIYNHVQTHLTFVLLFYIFLSFSLLMTFFLALSVSIFSFLFMQCQFSINQTTNLYFSLSFSALFAPKSVKIVIYCWLH